MPEEQFLTVSELARALSISERQAARWVSRVSDADRLTTDAGPTRVRLASVIALRSKATGKPVPSVKPLDSVSVTTDATSDMGLSKVRHDDSHASDATTAALAEVRAELELERRRAAVLEAEKEGLTARLADTASDRDAWKEQAREAMELARAAQAEVRSTRALSARSAVQIEPVQTVEGDSSPVSSSEGRIPPPDTAKRPFWALWKGKG